jgi:hypothetical protein
MMRYENLKRCWSRTAIRQPIDLADLPVKARGVLVLRSHSDNETSAALGGSEISRFRVARLQQGVLTFSIYTDD